VLHAVAILRSDGQRTIKVLGQRWRSMLILWHVHVNRVPLRPADDRAQRRKRHDDDCERPAATVRRAARRFSAGRRLRQLTRTHGPHMRRSIAAVLAAVSFIFAAGFALPIPARASHATVPATPPAIAAYASLLRKINPQMPSWQSHTLAKRVLVNAARWHLDATMLVAIVAVESSWHTHAISSAGAIGLGQLMPGTAALLRVNPHDPAQNLYGAARYLRGLMQRFGSKRYNLIFAAYNAGPKAVKEYGGIPPYDETEHYVTRVTATWERLAKTVHIPASAYAGLRAHGLDIDYWLEGQPNP